MPSKYIITKNFTLLLQGHFVSFAGQFLYVTGLVFWFKQVADSPTLIGMFFMSAMLPGVFLGPLGGVVADRYSRKKIIVWGNLINGSLIICVAGVMFFMPEAIQLTIFLLFVVAVVSGVIRAFFGPAMFSTIPDLVPRHKLLAANGILQSSTQFAMLGGQALGGVLFIVLGATTLIFVNGIGYLFAAISVAFITLPKRPATKPTGWSESIRVFKADMALGFSYIFSTPGLKELLYAVAVRAFFMAPVWTLLPFFVEDSLQSTPGWYGFLMGSLAFGMILGNGLAAMFKVAPENKSKLFLLIFFLFGMAICFFAHSPNIVVALVEIILIGGCMGYMAVLTSSTIHLNTRSEMRGRVSGLLMTVSSGLAPISMGLTGIVAELMDRNISLLYTISGLCILTTVCFLGFSKGFHQFMCYGTSRMPNAGET